MARGDTSGAGESGLLERHVGFLDALRTAGLPVSLAEGLDALAALRVLGLDDRDRVRAAYAATLVKKPAWDATFGMLFDLWFPARVGGPGRAGLLGDDDRGPVEGPGRDSGAALETFRADLADALAAAVDPLSDTGEPGQPGEPGGPPQDLAALAAEAVSRFGAMPGRTPGQSQWSAYQTLRRTAPGELVDRLVAGLLADADADSGDGPPAGTAERRARAAATRFERLVEAEARRRSAEQRGPEHVAKHAVRPSIDQLAFLSARRDDLEAMRREIYPLARRLAARLAREQHGRRGPLDVRRTVRASMSTGGVPLETRHRPRRPHRPDLVVLCDVSGSVASFAQFTLLLVHVLREHFQGLRAFTFVDRTVEVTDVLRPGGDVAEVMAELAASAQHAALVGRTNYGRAFDTFLDEHRDALGPKTSLLVLGDARSNYADLRLGALREIAGEVREAWWLNPEHRRSWDTGDSVASRYADVVPMVECRNLTQLADFVHDRL